VCVCVYKYYIIGKVFGCTA